MQRRGPGLSRVGSSTFQREAPAPGTTNCIAIAILGAKAAGRGREGGGEREGRDRRVTRLKTLPQLNVSERL